MFISMQTLRFAQGDRGKLRVTEENSGQQRKTQGGKGRLRVTKKGLG